MGRLGASGQPCLLQGAAQTSRRVKSGARRPSMEAISETSNEDSGGEERLSEPKSASTAATAASSPFRVPGLPTAAVSPGTAAAGGAGGAATPLFGLKGEPLPGAFPDPEEELTWFSAGLRLGAGLGVGVCIGACLGVSLLMKGYQNARGYASGAIRGRIFS